MLGIIVGSGFSEIKPNKSVKTPYGDVQVDQQHYKIVLQRHGKGVQPHKINHKANIMAMKELGVHAIVGVSSTGSLKEHIKPGGLVVVSDFMQLSGIPTFYEDKMHFTVPVISDVVRRMIIDACASLSVHHQGVYAQTSGPRFETAAEVRMLSHFADIVGMTIAKEATLACEAHIPYGALCSVDNYANGLGKLSMSDIKKNQAAVLKKIKKVLGALA